MLVPPIHLLLLPKTCMHIVLHLVGKNVAVSEGTNGVPQCFKFSMVQFCACTYVLPPIMVRFLITVSAYLKKYTALATLVSVSLRLSTHIAHMFSHNTLLSPYKFAIVGVLLELP